MTNGFLTQKHRISRNNCSRHLSKKTVAKSYCELSVAMQMCINDRVPIGAWTSTIDRNGNDSKACHSRLEHWTSTAAAKGEKKLVSGEFTDEKPGSEMNLVPFLDGAGLRYSTLHPRESNGNILSCRMNHRSTTSIGIHGESLYSKARKNW
jgi:hypothetical protein